VKRDEGEEKGTRDEGQVGLGLRVLGMKTNYKLIQKLYRYIFWTGYIAILITAFIAIPGDLSKIKLGRGIFEIRLDHLLHFTVYFLIAVYYLIGQWKGLLLFDKSPLWKFTVATLLLATISEVVQLWVPARSFNVMDWVANVAGMLIGLKVIRIKGSKIKD
jgi:hypothetical protein